MSGQVSRSDMKTVVMYIDFIYGKQNPTGGTNRYRELMYGLIEKGNVVHLFIPKDAELKSDPHLIRHDIKCYLTSSFLIPNGLLNFLANLKKLSSIRKINYDAIISFDVPCSVQFKLFNLGKLFLFIRQDFIGYRKISIGSDGLVKRIYMVVLKRIERSVLLHAHRIAVQCKYDKDILIKRHDGCKSSIEEKMFILNNNVNPSWVTSETCDDNKKKTNENIKLAFVGDLDDPRKGFGLLIGAVSRLLDEGEPLTLHVVGGANCLDHYKNQYRNRPNIKLWGKLKDPLRVTKECDLLIVPSLADSFPNTIIEAFYLELPVIGSNVGGIPEMLIYEDLIFTPTVADLVVKLRDIIHNKKLEMLRGYSKQRKKELTFDWVEKVSALI